MTESQWLAATDISVGPREFAVAHLSERKRRLFACACCRRIWDLLTDDALRKGVETAELLADRRLRPSARPGLRKRVARLGEGGHEREFAACAVRWAIERNPHFPLCSAQYASEARAFATTGGFQVRGYSRAVAAEQRQQIELLRDILGNPFRPVTIDLTWLTPAVLGIARGVYDERAFGDLPILADALEDAGCDDEQVLGHCRSARPHVLGCWAVDTILDRE
jgi:hypothetical protein